jgi:alkanesulfonate monooxygenase SsuD/methylene tetrahydromethanopterin reductase-like flavin-dependent oxidoreductase (luciferase family)
MAEWGTTMLAGDEDDISSASSSAPSPSIASSWPADEDEEYDDDDDDDDDEEDTAAAAADSLRVLDRLWAAMRAFQYLTQCSEPGSCCKHNGQYSQFVKSIQQVS